MKLRLLLLPALAALSCSVFAAGAAPAKVAAENTIYLDKLDLSLMSCGYKTARANKTVNENKLTIAGTVYDRGVGTHAHSEVIVDLHKNAEQFQAVLGVDDEEQGRGSVTFEIWGDNQKLTSTGAVHGGEPGRPVTVPLKGIRYFMLKVTDSGDGGISDHADIANAYFVMKSPKDTIATCNITPEPPYSIATVDFSKIGIYGPRVVGSTPGNPFIFRIPATGKNLRFEAQGLPAGLKLDTATGVISGSLAAPGTTEVTLVVKGDRGSAKRILKIIGGDHKLAQTPPMGWNSWNVWACAVDQDKVKAAADSLIKTGLASMGFEYINIDDCWQAKRDDKGEILPNERFPDMKGLCDYVHSLGLKIGIYSSPGKTTCGGYEASYQHELQDAMTYAKWGIDYLKYDWCSYGDVSGGRGLPQLQAPYKLMREALDKSKRDIVFSFCQYGMGKVWEWGANTGGNLWRTTGDINDSWSSLSNIGFEQTEQENYSSPGHWNDPDMMVVGKLGWGPNIHPTHLTPNEQITHVTLWSLLASPLLLGCDLTQLDKFTMSLLTNDEVINIDQDPLGRQAGLRWRHDIYEVWSRPLFDGSIAVGLFNRGNVAGNINLKWDAIGVTGKQKVRNVWQKKDLGVRENSIGFKVPAHGAILLKLTTFNQL